MQTQTLDGASSVDTVFQLPLPPVNAVFNLAVANFITVAVGVGLLLFLAWAVLRPGKRLISIAMLIGGAAVTFNEPGFDILNAVWHPIIGQNTAFTLLGRSVPLWAFPGYIAVYGCSALLMLEAFMRGISTRAIWLWCLVPILLDALLEIPLLQCHLYYYYANQPLDLLGYPLYQAPSNTAGIFFGVTVLYLLSPWLGKSWRWFPAAIIVLPLCGGMGFIGASLLPAFVVNAQNVPFWLTQLAGLACFALVAAWVRGIALLVAVDSPYRYNLPQQLPQARKSSTPAQAHAAARPI
jgi:hypothetical protein